MDQTILNQLGCYWFTTPIALSDADASPALPCPQCLPGSVLFTARNHLSLFAFTFCLWHCSTWYVIDCSWVTPDLPAGPQRCPFLWRWAVYINLTWHNHKLLRRRLLWLYFYRDFSVSVQAASIHHRNIFKFALYSSKHCPCLKGHTGSDSVL